MDLFTQTWHNKICVLIKKKTLFEAKGVHVIVQQTSSTVLALTGPVSIKIAVNCQLYSFTDETKESMILLAYYQFYEYKGL